MYKDLIKNIKKTERLEKGSRQRRMPFNPENTSTSERKQVESWVRQGGNEDKYGEKDRESIPKMNPNAKTRSIDKLSKYTKSKVHPETKERMLLLHRGVSGEEHGKIKAGGNSGTLSSWTPKFNEAKLFASKYNPDAADEGESNIISAWIPESQMQHIPNSVGSIRDQKDYDIGSGTLNPKTRELEGTTHKRKGKVGQVTGQYRHEQEVIVNPHTFELHNNEDLKEKHAENEEYDDDHVDNDHVEWDLRHNKGKLYSPHERISNRVAIKRNKDAKKELLKEKFLENARNKMTASEKTFSRQEVIDMIKLSIMKKSNEYEDIDIEDLEKNWRKAFANGLTALAMIHGAHYMGQNPGEQSERVKSPTYQKVVQRMEARRAADKGRMPSSNMTDEEQIQHARESARAEGQAIIDKHDRGNGINNFLENIAMVESSGGKNTNHKEMKHGIHAGDSAIGKYGLMPNTIKEMAGRMGKDNPLSSYAKMDSKSISESISKNPDHEHGIATFMANHLKDKFGGDENKMSYSWNQGHNLQDKHFKTSHKDYVNHDYVQKFNKYKGSPKNQEKTPSSNNLASN